MSRRIGLHLTRDHIHAVVVRDAVVAAMATCSRDASTGLRDQVEALFEMLPSPCENATITVAVDPPVAWSKRIAEGGAIKNARAREQAVAANADQYFLGDAGSRVIAVKATNDVVLADSYDASVVATLTGALKAWRPREARIVTAANLTPKALQKVDERFAVALAATTFDTARGPSHRLGEGRTVSPRWRSRAAVGASLIAAAFLLASPIARARRVAASARAEIRAVAAAYSSASRQTREIDRARADLSALDAARGGITVSSLLGQFTRALPRNSALIAFSFDTANGSAVVVSSSVVNVLPALDGVSAIGSARLSGPITRERVGDRDLERATVLLTWRAIP